MNSHSLIACVLPGSACDILDLDSDCLELGGNSYTGVWTINGTGTLSNCELGAPLDGSVSIEANSLQIRREGSGELVLIDGPEGFRIVSSKVSGSSVSFVTEEDTPEGTIRIQFSGDRESCSFVEGSMTGTLPGGCSLDGSFSVDIVETEDFLSELEERFGVDSPEESSEGEGEEEPDATETEDVDAEEPVDSSDSTD